MGSINIEIPDAVLEALSQSREEFVGSMRRNHAMELFREAQLTLSQAAILAGMPLSDFMEFLAAHKVSVFNFSTEELSKELTSLGGT